MPYVCNACLTGVSAWAPLSLCKIRHICTVRIVHGIDPGTTLPARCAMNICTVCILQGGGPGMHCVLADNLAHLRQVRRRFLLKLHRNCLFAPELQWQSRGKMAYLTGVEMGTFGVGGESVPGVPTARGPVRVGTSSILDVYL